MMRPIAVNNLLTMASGPRRGDVLMSMNNAAVTRIVIETTPTTHNVYTAGGVYLGPIALKHGDAFDVIPKAIRRAEVYGWSNVSRDVEFRRFGFR